MTDTEKGPLYVNSLAHPIQNLSLSWSAQEWAPLSLVTLCCLNGYLPFLENIHRFWPRKRPTWFMTHGHLLTHYFPSKDVERAFSWEGGRGEIRKTEPGSVFFTEPFWGFRRAWNAVTTNVKSTVVHYEVIQCYCYLTYKQLLSTNVNCHWDLELLYTSEINLVLRLAQNSSLPCSQSSP